MRVVGILKGMAKVVGIGVGLLLLSILSGYIAMNLVLDRGKLEVPIVIGLDLKMAADQLRLAGFQPRMATKEYSSNFPKGTVVRQSPSGGSRLHKGKEVRLTVSKGTDEILAPDLVGGDLTRGQRILAEQGLTLGRITKVHSNTFPAGEVIAQDPAPGLPTRRGTALHLLISLGGEEDYYLMPNLVGVDATDALALVKKMRLDAKVSYTPMPDYAAKVVAQDPSFGTRIKEREQVSLVIGQ